MITLNFAQYTSAQTKKMAKFGFRMGLSLLLMITIISKNQAQERIEYTPDLVTVKSSQFPGTNHYLIDGDLSTIWNSKRPNYPSVNNPEVLTYFFQTPKKIDSLVIVSIADAKRTEDITKFTFEASNSGNEGDWTILGNNNVNFTAASQPIGFSYNNEEEYAFYRIVITEKVVPEIHRPNSKIAETTLFGGENTEDPGDDSGDDTAVDPTLLWKLRSVAPGITKKPIYYTAGPVEMGPSLVLQADENDEGVTGIAFQKSNGAFSGGISFRDKAEITSSDLTTGENYLRFNLYNPITDKTPGMKLSREGDAGDEAWLLINSTNLQERPSAPLHVIGETYLDGDLVANGIVSVEDELRVSRQATFYDGLSVNEGLTIFDDTVAIGTRQNHPSAILTIDGHVHISESGGTNNTMWEDSLSNDYLVWIEKGMVTENIALASPNEWMDIVFEEDYNLLTLEEVEAHINVNGYLHTMPSGQEVTEKGYTLHDMNKRMVQTIEELTLHTIDQEKQIDSQKEMIDKLINRLARLENLLKVQSK